MGPADVLAVLRDLGDAGVQVWIGGGWGIDALLGQQSRPHDDLDLSLDVRDQATAIAALAAAGYAVVTDQLPVRLVLGDALGRRVDLHPVHFDATGAGVQIGFDGPLHYPRDGFARGTIDGQAVDCFSAALQLQFHTGYPPQAKDRRDMQRLAERTGIALPAALDDEAGATPETPGG
jgi:lincosamide nucleotidyltransferase A/C/D/E